MAPKFKAIVKTWHRNWDGSSSWSRQTISLGCAETLEQAERHALRWLRSVGANMQKAQVVAVWAA